MTSRHLFTSEYAPETDCGAEWDHDSGMNGRLYAPSWSSLVPAVIALERKKELLPILRANFDLVSQREIARRLGLGHTTVNRWTAEMGLRYEKFACDESFFDRWTEYSAYVLGYVFTDGNVQHDLAKSRWGLTITASEKDQYHLERIRRLLRITKPLLFAPRTRSYRMNIANRVLAEKLIGLGVVPAKSLVVGFPRIPTGFLRHFMRGVVDGDGSVFYFDRPRSPYFTVRIFSGSRRFLVGAEQAIRKETQIEARIRTVHRNAYVLDYTCYRAERLGFWLYRGSHIFLERKHEAYLAMISQRYQSLAE